MQCLVLHLDIALRVELQFAQELVDDALLIVGWFPVPFLECLAVIQRPKRDGGLQVRIASAGCIFKVHHRTPVSGAIQIVNGLPLAVSSITQEVYWAMPGVLIPE